MKSAIFTFGRFNPPTIGHMLLISSMKRTASKMGADIFVFTGTSNDKTRNPLKYTNKVSIMKKAFVGVTVVNNSKLKTVFQGLEYLDNLGYEDISMVVGSDRVSEFRVLISKYLKNYNFKSFNVISAGDRDPDADDVSGMSASKMRMAAKDGDYNAFKLGVPATMNDAETLKTFKLVQKGMGVKHFIKESWFDFEEFEMFAEKVVSLQTRRKMAKVAKRTAKKRAKIRKRKEKFMKTTGQLKTKAEKQAKMLLRKKMLGDVNWAELSPTAKMQFDKRLAKKAGVIKKIAKKLYPKVKKAEKERLQKLRIKTPGQPSNTSETQTEDYAKLKDRRAYLKKTVKQRTARVLARRKLEKEGKVCKGDGKDVDHRNGNPEDNSSGNLRVMSASKNRGRDNNKWRKKTNEDGGAGEEGTGKLLKKYTKDTPLDKKFKNKVKKVNGK
jgi:hypothetical protein